MQGVLTMAHEPRSHPLGSFTAGDMALLGVGTLFWAFLKNAALVCRIIGICSL